MSKSSYTHACNHIERINRLIIQWENERRTFSHLDNDDSDFFKLIGKSPMEVGTTSVTGNDLVYYDTNAFDSDSDAIKNKRQTTSIERAMLCLTPKQLANPQIAIATTCDYFGNCTFYQNGKYYSGKRELVYLTINTFGSKPTEEQIEETKEKIIKAYPAYFTIDLLKVYATWKLEATVVKKPKQITLKKVYEELEIQNLLKEKHNG